jgi:AraC-like DNA-binding protein
MSGRQCPEKILAGCAPERRSAACLVEKAERLVLADLQAPFDIADLCRELAVSERTLRKAFHRMRGQPPYRCLQSLKFAAARKSLMSARNRSMTVTEIALRYGFSELGRFAVEYRKMFGLSPSETLRRAVREGGRDDGFSSRLTSQQIASDLDPTDYPIQRQT